MSLFARIQRPTGWREPVFEQPLLLDERELKLLGEHRNTKWFSSKLGELAERRAVHSDATLPNGPILRIADEGGEPRYRGFSVHAPGTFAGLRAAVAKPQKAPPPARPVDELARIPLLGGSPGRIIPLAAGSGLDRLPALGQHDPESLGRLGAVLRDRGGSALMAGGKPPIATPREFVAYLERKGIHLASTPGGRLLVTAPRGRLDDGYLTAIKAMERLLVGLVSGSPVGCELDHRERDIPEAVRLVAVSVAACAAHARGEL